MNGIEEDLTFVTSLEDPRMQQAIAELTSLISRHYPDATFEAVEWAEDPEGVFLLTTVDLFDTDPVVDLVIDRVNHFIVDDHIALWVLPVRTAEREADVIAANRAARNAAATGD